MISERSLKLIDIYGLKNCTTDEEVERLSNIEIDKRNAPIIEKALNV